MKIGILSREYPPLTHVGGIATYSATAASLLAGRGHAVEVVCNGPEHSVSVENGVKVHRIPMLTHPLPRGPLWYPYRQRYRRWLPIYLDAVTWARSAARYLGSAFDPSGFDVWEYPETMGEGAYFPALRDTTLICRIHSGWMDDSADNFLERALILRLQRRACLRADRVVSPSHYMAEHYARKTLRLRRPVTVSRNPFAPWEEPIDWATKRPGNLLYVGRIEHRKGLQVLLAALDSLGEAAESIVLRVVGQMHPPAREDDRRCMELFKSRLETHGIGVDGRSPRGRYGLEYAGPCGHGEIRRHFDWAGLQVIPSLIENYPYVALEGLSRGCILAASHVGGLPEILDRPRRGWLFPAENSASLAKIIGEWVGLHREIPASARENAAEMWSEFSADACYRALMETYGAESKRDPL